MHYISNTGYININNWETSWINIQKIIKTISQQESIPVGCVPSAAVAVSGWLGAVCPRWVSTQGGCLPRWCLSDTQSSPGGQNDRQVLKHYLVATTFRTVKIP